MMEPVTDENEKDLLMLDANSGPLISLPSDLVSSLFFGLVSNIGSSSEWSAETANQQRVSRLVVQCSELCTQGSRLMIKYVESKIKLSDSAMLT